MKSGFSLKQIWMTLILFAVLVPVIIIMILFSLNNYNYRLDSALTIEHQTNELLRNQVEASVKYFRSLLRNKSDPLSILLDKSDDPNTLDDINKLLTFIVEREQAIQEVMILSKQGNVLAVIDPGIDMLGKRSLAVEESHLAALHWGFGEKNNYPEVVIPLLGKDYIGPPRKHEGFTVFSMAVPIGSPSKAILVALINVNKLWPDNLNSKYVIGEIKTLNYMLDQQGLLLTKINGSNYIPGDLMKHLEITRSPLINAEWKTEASYIGVLEQPVYGSITTIPLLNWTLISEVSVSSITQPILASLIKIVLVTLFIMIIFVWFVLHLASKTIKPIKQVCEAIEHVARGDYEVFLQPCGIRDLDALTLGFNSMAKTRQQVENQLQEREQDIAITLNSIGDAVIATDVDGKVTRMNPVAERLTGWMFDEAKGKLVNIIFPIIHATTRESIEIPIEKVISFGETISLSNHTTLISKDGTEYQIADSAAPIRDNGKILGMILVFNDVTTQYRMREKIHSSEQHLKLYHEQAPLAVIEWNVDFQVVDWNIAAEKMFGYTLDEVKGRYFVDIMLPENAIVDVKQIWKDLIAQTGGTKSINENITKDDLIILCEWHNTPIKDESGKVIGAASIVQNITEEHKAKQELLHKEFEQREILNTIVDAVITIDETGTVLSFNKMAETLFGYDADEIIGENVNQLMPEPFSNQHDGYIKNYIDTGDAHIIGLGREVEAQHKNKTTFPIRLSVAELPNSGGKRRFVGSCQDLTKIKQQEEQLRRSLKMDALGKLTGGIAHDYNNMLAVIIGYSEILMDSLNEQPKLAKYANEIHHAGKRGAKLTNKLLGFSRKKNTESTVLNLNLLLQEEYHMLTKTLTSRIQLDIELADNLWTVKIDEGDMEDTIINLCINSMHAIEGNGQLTLRTSNEHLTAMDAKLLGLKSGEHVLFSITDSGSGMNETTKEKMFEPFYTTKGEKGTGLGLSQVYGFVKRSNGAIKVYSELGHGTRFALYFPRFKGTDSDEKSTKEYSTLDFKGNETILVVDDEPALLNLTREILSAEGYNVICVQGGRQALDELATKSIDLLISDIIMPEMDGYQLAKIVQEKHPTVKIQLVSGFSDSRHKIFIDDALYKKLIYKPYNSITLMQQIRILLDE